MTFPKKAFDGLLDITIDDFLQLPKVKGKFMFSWFSDKDSMKQLLRPAGITFM